MAVDNIRHLKVFDGRAFKESVHIIGCGATGSFLALHIAKLGVEDIHLWDFDQVEEHNLANQLYGVNDIGKPKVEALAAILKDQADIDVKTHCEKVTNQKLHGYVFLLTDTMESRKEIFENSMKYKPPVKFMIETRMGTLTHEVRCINPNDPTEVESWMKEWFPDEPEVVDPSNCNARTTLGFVANHLACTAVAQFVKKAGIEEKAVESMTFNCFEPMMIERNQYKKAS